jgi:hypothetical protein
VRGQLAGLGTRPRAVAQHRRPVLGAFGVMSEQRIVVAVLSLEGSEDPRVRGPPIMAGNLVLHGQTGYFVPEPQAISLADEGARAHEFVKNGRVRGRRRVEQGNRHGRADHGSDPQGVSGRLGESGHPGQRGIAGGQRDRAGAGLHDLGHEERVAAGQPEELIRRDAAVAGHQRDGLRRQGRDVDPARGPMRHEIAEADPQRVVG